MTMEVASEREYLPPVGVALRRGFPRDGRRDALPIPPAWGVPRFRLRRAMGA